MRPILAALLLGFSILPQTAAARKRPPKVFPALANAKVLGVQCRTDASHFDPAACRRVVNSLQSHLGTNFKIVYVGDMGKRRGPSAVKSAIQPDVYVRVWDASIEGRDFQTGVVTETANFEYELKDARTSKRLGIHEGGLYSVTSLLDSLNRYIFLHSGLAAKQCAAVKLNEGNEVEFCKQNGLLH